MLLNIVFNTKYIKLTTKIMSLNRFFTLVNNEHFVTYNVIRENASIVLNDVRRSVCVHGTGGN